ncbi:hypothetical protein OS493_018747 [Desmophyllum pertusum]|uniref:Uncharacterized protein n=1 Tax=Desmophyllum pertusum TaxID=174260 RepID=A0A9W9ZNN9_9CNID|nr:hypothetical protein OS493_018747 [Desmophyllum pertusum]
MSSLTCPSTQGSAVHDSENGDDFFLMFIDAGRRHYLTLPFEDQFLQENTNINKENPQETLLYTTQEEYVLYVLLGSSWKKDTNQLRRNSNNVACSFAAADRQWRSPYVDHEARTGLNE